MPVPVSNSIDSVQHAPIVHAAATCAWVKLDRHPGPTACPVRLASMHVWASPWLHITCKAAISRAGRGATDAHPPRGCADPWGPAGCGMAAQQPACGGHPLRLDARAGALAVCCHLMDVSGGGHKLRSPPCPLLLGWADQCHNQRECLTKDALPSMRGPMHGHGPLGMRAELQDTHTLPSAALHCACAGCCRHC